MENNNKNDIRVIIAGSRDFADYSTLSNIAEHILRLYVYKKGFEPEDIEIISGGAKGADILGERYGYVYGYKTKRFPANWDLYGKSAGYIRNKEMAKYASYKKGYGALIAFWDGKSKGTKNMISIAKEYGLKVFIYYYKDNTWEMQ